MARLCLALLRNLNNGLNVVEKSVRNFDMVSYHRGNQTVSSFFMVAGGGLMSSVISTIPLQIIFLIRRNLAKELRLFSKADVSEF